MKNWSTTKKIVVLLAVIAIVLIAWNWDTVSKQLGIGSSIRKFRAGGIGSGEITPRPMPAKPTNQVIVNPIVVERQSLRCCDWLDMAAYQACLSAGHSNCGNIYLSNCSQSEVCNATRMQPFTIDQINIEAPKRNISDNIRLAIVNGRSGR